MVDIQTPELSIILFHKEMGNSYEQIITDCFTQARITDELCPSSIKKYWSSIRCFWGIVGDKKVEDLTKADFDNFIIKMKDRGASNTRIANVISAVKWVLAKAQENGLAFRDLDLLTIKKPKIMRKEVVYLTEEEVGHFIRCIAQEIEVSATNRSVRFLALVFLLLQTGARIGEVLSANVDDIDWGNKEMNIIGKGNKPRTLILTDNTIFWLKRYLALRNDNEAALFVTLDGGARWQQTDVGRSFRKYRLKSGIKKKFTPHTLRHTFATQYITKGASLNTVQAALGHSEATTTLKYYVGAVHKAKVREMINDEHFNFIPSSAIK